MDERDVEQSLESSVKDVAAYGQMVGFGEAYFGAFAVWQGATNWMLGLLGTLPPFIGACMQPAAAWLVDRTARRRRLYLLGAMVQQAMFVPICISVFLPRAVAIWMLLASVIVYFAGVHFSTPPWNSVMGDLVPAGGRGRFFAYRNRIFIISQWMATVVAGIGLEVFKRANDVRWGFALIFTAALVSRIISVWHLGQMKEPPFGLPAAPDRAPFLDWMFGSNFSRFALFMAAINFSVAVSGPYFTPYMLHDLGFSYTQFMISQMVLIFGQVLLLQRWGRLGDRVGNRKILAITAFGVAIVPMLWQFARSPVTVWMAQILAGLTWSGFSLAAGNFLLDALPRERWARGAAQLNLFSGIGILLGGLFGSLIVDWLPDRYVFFGISVAFFSHLQVIMLISGFLRLASIALFLGRFSEVRRVPDVGMIELLLGSEGKPGDPSSS